MLIVLLISLIFLITSSFIIRNLLRRKALKSPLNILDYEGEDKDFLFLKSKYSEELNKELKITRVLVRKYSTLVKPKIFKFKGCELYWDSWNRTYYVQDIENVDFAKALNVYMQKLIDAKIDAKNKSNESIRIKMKSSKELNKLQKEYKDQDSK